ncbi:MAG TPA: oxidoreductase [Bacteroidales bacterium]|nr:oxidoreductase [Bacteroidales bacterium]
MELLTPTNWPNYELIDSGDFEKLERFGDRIVARPEPQAMWDKTLSNEEWKKMADAYFINAKSDKGSNLKNDGERGEWKLKPGLKEQWYIDYNYKEMNIRFRLGLTSFKHIGIFPEQASNWNYIYDSIKSINQSNTKVLNLFSYTGGASLAAKAAGADVTHLDSVKQVVTWARENMEASGLKDIRWIIDDAVKFVSREVRRGNQYNGIILDPPAFGRGPEGEMWKLEDCINDLLKNCNQILAPSKSFLILNIYSLGFSALIAENFAKTIFGIEQPNYGELFVSEREGRRLPLGVFARFRRP